MRGIMYFCRFICPLYFLSLYLCHRIFAVVFRLLWSGLEVDDLAAFLSSAMSFTFICFLFLICNPFSVLKVAQARYNIPLLIVMDHNLKDDGFCESGVNEDIPLRNKNNEGEKSNKCNQCEYAPSKKSSFRSHLKIHSGDKSNKCNQCDYACSQAGTLRRHLKTHSGEKPNKCNQCNYASSYAHHLKTHLKTHKGEKSNKCKQCDFASSPLLRQVI